VPTFGDKLPQLGRRGRQMPSAAMFPEGEELPLFSGTPIPATERPYVPQDHSMKQTLLPGMPAIDYGHILELDKARRHRHQRGQTQEGATLFLPAPGEPVDPAPQQLFPPEPLAALTGDEQRQRLQALVLPYIDLVTLRRLAATGQDIQQSLRVSGDEVPAEITAILETIAALLCPSAREQIKSPADVAALLMIEMSRLDQEQMKVVCLDTKNRV
jgi:hypothetical protein